MTEAMGTLLEEAFDQLDWPNLPFAPTHPPIGTVLIYEYATDNKARTVPSARMCAGIVKDIDGDKLRGVTYAGVESWQWENRGIATWKLPPQDLHDRIWAEHCATVLMGDAA